MKKNISLKRIVSLIIGQFIMAFGINLIIYLDIGVDPLGVFHTGVATSLKVSFGMALFIENLIALILIFFWDKRYIHVGTILTLFIVSLLSPPITSLYSWLIPSDIPYFFSVTLLLVACFIMGVGLNIYVLSDIGVGAMDAIPEIISERFSIKIGMVKMILDFVYLAFGILLSGAIGFGTIICALALGPCIQVSRKPVSQILDKRI